MKKTTILAIAFLFAVATQAQTVSFEESEGYQLGNVDGQDGWESMINFIEVSDQEASDGEWSLFVGKDNDGDIVPDELAGAERTFSDETLNSGTVTVSYDFYLPSQFDKPEDVIVFTVADENGVNISEASINPGNAYASQGVEGDGIAAFRGWGQGANDPAPTIGNWLTTDSGIYFDEWTTISMEYNFDIQSISYQINEAEVFSTDFYEGESMDNYAVLTTGAFEMYIDNITASGDLSVEDFEVSTFKHYVNNNQLFLNSDTQIGEVAIFNLLGQQVVSESINGADGIIDLNSLTTGVYLSKVSVNGQVKSFKFIKK